MNIISNYNLSIYPKTNNQKSKTNPNFGISTKNLTLPLGITAAGIGAVVPKLMKVDPNTVLGMYGNPDSGKTVTKLINSPADVKVSELIDLPADEYGYTKLHYWCEDGNVEKVKKFLDKNSDINLSQMDRHGYTYMHYALKSNNKDIIKLIAGMDSYNPTIPDKNGWTDLHYLCGYGYTEVIKTLLQKHPDIDINQQTKHGDTCMTLAAQCGHKDLVNLIDGMDSYNPTIPDKNGYTDFHRLCEIGYTDVVKDLMAKHPEFDINQKTNGGDTCMSLAIDNKQKDVINLIANMDNYNPTIPNEDGRTDLHYLCAEGYTDVVKILLEKHPEFDINQQTKYGDTCMSVAINYRNEGIVNLIAGMDNYKPDNPDKNGWTVFHYLCRNGYTDVLKTLLEKHPEFDINQQAKYGITCMSLAVWNRYNDIINLIASMDNYNPAIPDEEGVTDLDYLSRRGYTNVIEALLKKQQESDKNPLT